NAGSPRRPSESPFYCRTSKWHELNNPLTGILGNAELLLVESRGKKMELTPLAQSRLETIAALAVRMRETVRRLSEEWEMQAVEPAGDPGPRREA
ncbi:MAG: histidine kinase dimerization/phospho-acceptor domain-containing protein, partial [Candidatus Acidiferrum sp.]